MTARIPHWSNGKAWEGTADVWAEVTNPATGEVSGQVALACQADADHIIAAAVRGAEQWAATSVARRTQVLFAFRELLDAGAGELAAILTAEHGKRTADALGELARGQEVVELACGVGHLLKGAHSHGVSTGVDVHSRREPVGVVAVISPFNFPAMVPMWFFPLALAAGNAVVLKPSEKDPSAALWMARKLQEAGLPDGVFNVLQGDKTAVDALLNSPDVAAVSFVGSTPVARYVYERGTASGKRVQALGGAKNHMVVLPDADTDLAADAVVGAGYGSAGERCMAISVLVAVDPVGDDLVERVAERTRALVTGDGDTDMGPLITRAHRDRVIGLIDGGEQAGAKVMVDGRGIDRDGFWLGPTLFDQVTPEMEIYTEEIFGPVLSVVRVPSYDAAVALVNASPYGNGVAVFTRDGGAARRFEQDVQVGMVGVNVAIPVPVAYHSFGGWKASLFGDTHAYGTDGIHFFTRAKVVTSRWPDPADDPRGVELGFPSHD